MDRLNPEGIRRDHLLWVMKDRRSVLTARRFDTCLLCRRQKVNEAGLCVVCYSQLDGEELAQARRWLSGVGP